MQYKVLLVDDDPLQHEILTAIVRDKLGYKVISLNDGKKAIDLLNSSKGSDINLVLLDILMPDISGIEVLQAVRPLHPEMGIIVVTASEDINTAIKATKLGADDFVLKNESLERITTSIENTLEKKRLSNELSRLEREAKGQIGFSDIVGVSSPSMQHAINVAKKASNSEIPVLLKGESGVGKELFARAIHGHSKRLGKPFIAINCGAIPENLVESTLFGHEKGAFTGASQSSVGKFREADGGTIFLDEVGELKPEVQTKLLRVLQSGEIEPVGAGKPINVNVRVVSATHRNLEKEINTGRFREDLFYRLNVFPISIPSLRDRAGDVDLLIDHFFSKFVAKENKRIQDIDDEARALLRSYHWPGNIRQLENAIFRAVVMSDNDVLQIRDFSYLEVSGKKVEQLARGKKENLTNINLLNDSNGFKNFQTIEREYIKSALEFYNWKISEVARRIGMGRSTLYRKMDELGIHQSSSFASGDNKDKVGT